MSKTLFKRALSLTAAALMGIMTCVSQLPPVQVSAAADISVNAAATVPAVTTTSLALDRFRFSFNPNTATIKTGEEITVELLDSESNERWDKEELPEFTIGDPEVVSIEKGEETGTFIVKGLSMGSTFVRFIYNGYADFAVNVTDENGELVTQTNEAVPEVTTLPSENVTTDPEYLPMDTTTAPLNTVPTTTAPIETVTSLQSSPQTTTTSAGIVLKCEPSYLQIKEGQSIMVELYCEPDSVPYSGEFPTVIIDDETIASTSPCDFPRGFYINGLSEGGTYAEISVDFMDEVLTAQLPIEVLPKNVNTDITDTTGTTFTTTADPFGNTVTLPNSTTAPSNTVPTTAPTGETVTTPDTTTTPNSSTGTVPTFTTTAVTSSTSATQEPPVSDKTGDINIDGTVNISDATNVLNIYACMAAGMEIAFENADAADINGDGKVDTSDAACILTYYAYKSAGLPCTWEDIIR